MKISLKVIVLIVSMLSVGALFAQNCASESNNQIAAQKDSLKRTFEHLSIDGTGLGMRFLAESHIIKRGDSTRIKFVFDQNVKYIKIEGVGETNHTDIKNKVWIATLKPTKTKTYKIEYALDVAKMVPAGAMFSNMQGDNSAFVNRLTQRIIVLAPGKYDEVMTKKEKLKTSPEELKSYMDGVIRESLKD